MRRASSRGAGAGERQSAPEPPPTAARARAAPGEKMPQRWPMPGQWGLLMQGGVVASQCQLLGTYIHSSNEYCGPNVAWQSLRESVGWHAYNYARSVCKRQLMGRCVHRQDNP